MPAICYTLLAQCQEVCGRVAACEQLIEACGADRATALGGRCIAACDDEDLQRQILAVEETECAAVTPLAIDSFGLGTVCGPLAPNLECGEDYVFTPAVDDTITLDLVLDTFTGDTIDGLQVRGCAIDDDECDAPLAEGVADEEGRLSLELPTRGYGWDGYLEIIHADIEDAVVLFAIPVVESRELRFSVSTPALTVQFSAIYGVETVDPERGSLVAGGLDCDGTPIAGATITVANADENTGGGYLAGGAPSAAATVTGQDGLVVLFNIPAGRTEVALELPGAEPRVVATLPLLVRAGFLTEIIIPPPITYPQD